MNWKKREMFIKIDLSKFNNKVGKNINIFFIFFECIKNYPLFEK